MARIETWLKTDLQQIVKVQELDGNLFSADNQANRIGVIVTNKGQDVELTESISGYLIRSDDDTVLVVGASSGNRAWIDLPASAYVKTGPIHIVIKAGETTVGACTGYVRRSTTDTIVDPGHIVPSIAELLAQIETMRQLSQTVTQQESGRVTAESGRVTAESARASAESARATAEVNRGNAETGRTNAETARVNAENARANAETARVNAENARAAAESGRADAETVRANAETSRANAESARNNAETVRANAETARGAAETARVSAESARVGAEASRVSAESQRETDFAAAKAAAEAATASANTAAGKINNMTVAASGLPAGSSPTVAISEVDGHKHIVFGLVKGDPGKDFEIRKTFTSIAQMEAYDPETDPSAKKVRENDFVMIDTGSVQDVDTGKLFCYEPDTIDVWRYIGDLSGSQGIKGETGTGIANITLNPDYTLTITMDDGTTSYTTASIRGAQGPQGAQGDPGADGSDGADGFSPTVTVTAITGGHRVSVADATTTHTFDVFDGINGTDGADGADGSDGADGADGTSAYLYIRYSHTQPTQDSDMGTTPDDWMGIYSGTSSTPPTAYTDYAWYKIKGETGSVQNVYANTIEMSSSDSTKISAAIAAKMDALNAAAPYDNTATYAEGAYCFHDGLKKCTTAITTAEEWTAAHWTNTTIAAELRGKVDANQGAGNAGKALGINNQGYVVPVPFSGEDFRGATDQAAGTHGYVPAPAAGDQGKFLKGDGSWGTVPNPQNMGGATAQAAGTAGLAPAPAAGDQGKFLRGDGSWANTPYPGTMTGATASTAGSAGLAPAPSAGDQNKVLNGAGQWSESPGTKRYPVTITVTGSGAYDHTFDYTDATGIDVVTEDMIVDRIEIGNPDAFDAKQRFTCGNGTIRLRCDSVNGTSTVVCWVQKAATDPETITSTEFDILNNRMLVLENVESNTAITIHPADWTLDNGVYKYTWTNSKVSTKTAVDVQFLAGAEDADTDTIFVEKVTGAVELTMEWLPDEDIPVNIKVTYARASDIANLTGEDIATDAIGGASNVDEALEIANGSKFVDWSNRLSTPITVDQNSPYTMQKDGYIIALRLGSEYSFTINDNNASIQDDNSGSFVGFFAGFVKAGDVLSTTGAGSYRVAIYEL